MDKSNLEAIREAVHRIIPNSLLSEISDDAELQADLGIDSIMMVELLIELEEQFNFEFDDMDLLMDNFLSVSTICSFLESKYLK